MHTTVMYVLPWVVSFPQVHAMFDGVYPDIVYQALEDPVYRPNWDDAVLADDTICRVEGCNSDICYYASKDCLLHYLTCI